MELFSQSAPPTQYTKEDSSFPLCFMGNEAPPPPPLIALSDCEHAKIAHCNREAVPPCSYNAGVESRFRLLPPSWQRSPGFEPTALLSLVAKLSKSSPPSPSP